MKFNIDIAIKGALVVAILIVIGVSAHLYSKRKEEHFEGNIDIDALRGFSKGEPGSNWNEQTLWSKGNHTVSSTETDGGTKSAQKFKNNIVDMILGKAGETANTERQTVQSKFDSKIATVQSDMNAISNQVATNKSVQADINANHKTVQAGEQSRISKQIATDNQEDEKKIAAAVAAQATVQTAIDNTQDITITSMASKNNTQDNIITKLDLPVGTIMAYAPKSSLGNVNSKGSIRWNLWEKGWAVCDQNASEDTAPYNNEYIPNLTDRFLKGHDFTPATISKETAINKRIGQSVDANGAAADGHITIKPKQIPPHSHTYKAIIGRGKDGDDSDDRYQPHEAKDDLSTGNCDACKGKPIDIRPPFYKVVYIMKFKILG